MQIRMIVPFPAGGPTDIVARPLAQALGEALKANLIIDNRGGAGGSIGATAVARSAPDGRTLLMATVGTQAINAALYQNLAYDPVRDSHADRHGGDGAGGHRGRSGAAGEKRCRVGRTRQAHARQTQLWLGRPGNAGPPHRGDVQVGGRRQYPACSLQGQRARADRSAGGTDSIDVRSAAIGAGTGAGRQDPRARRQQPKPRAPILPDVPTIARVRISRL